MTYGRSAAWLLGLEGVALLRALAGDRDYDKAFVDARLAEVRDIVTALDEPPFSGETWTDDIGTRQGYACACEEPAWGVIEGPGGGLAQRFCPEATAAAYRDTPAAIIGQFERCR